MFGLDHTTMTFIFSAALAAMTSTAYYLTRQGIPQMNLKSEDLQKIAKGVMKGTLHTEHLDNILGCVTHPDDIISAFEVSVQTLGKEDLQMMDIMSAVTTIGASMNKIAASAKNCDNDITKREFEILSKMTENFKNPQELTYKIGTNIMVNGVNIYQEMNAGYTNYLAKEYEAFGRDVGVALTMIFIGASNTAKINPGMAKVMESMAEMELYPEITDQVYTDVNNAKWIDYLDQISKEDETNVVPNYNSLLNLPQLVINQEQYNSLINTMSKQNQNAYLH